MNDLTPMSRSSALPARYHLTRSDYYRMAETGILAPDARVELLNGEIYTMAPIGSGHNYAVMSPAMHLNRLLGEHFVIQCQGPLLIGAESEPEPDVMVLSGPIEQYRTRKPEPADVVLLIEVAESSLKLDREIKAALYAGAGIADYWIVNLVDRVVEINRDPQDGIYATRTVLQPHDQMMPLLLKDILISMGMFF
jgi:Uma2 family endonuclease